jgi:hypothetical protein
LNKRASRRADSLGAIAAGTLVIVFCGLLLWHNPLVFWNDDYEISILPVFADVARSWSDGHLPLLSPYSWVCSNLAGEFQYGTFSLFVNAAVVLIWKFPLAFAQQAAALSMTHLFVLGAGSYLLARGRNLSAPLATMVALVGALNGWIICWGASDWFGALGAFAWLPWAWWGMERALDPTRTKWRFLWPAPFVYLLVTGGFPYTVLMLALLAGWLAVKFATANSSFGESLGQTRRLSTLWPLALGLAVGFGLSAPAWLALFDYVHGSARGEQANPGSHWQWLVPPAALPGFILPSWTVRWSDFSTRSVPHVAIELACGTVPPLALLAGLFFRRGQFVRRMKWELGLLVVILLIAMLPSANVFRWSFRWLPLLHLTLALIAAEAVAQFQLRALWNWLLAGAVFGSLLVTYLVLPTHSGVPKYHFPASLTSPQPLDPARLYLSIYPPPETAYRVENHPSPVGQVTRPGSTSMWAGLRFINGYSPIRGAGVGRAFAFYTHGEIDPAMADYLLGWQAGPEGWLKTIGVDGIILATGTTSPAPPSPEWSLVYESDEGRVYHRRGGPLSPVRSVASLDTSPNEKFGRAVVTLREDSRNRSVADVRVPNNGSAALLVVSRPYFNGYQARLGGKTLSVDSYRGLIPTIRLPSGTAGRLTITYRPWWLLWGGGIAALSASLCLVSAWRALRA